MPIQHPSEHILSPFFAHKSDTNVRIYVGYDIHSRIGCMEPHKHKNDWYNIFLSGLDHVWIVFGSESCLWKHGSREGSTQLHKLQQRGLLAGEHQCHPCLRPGCMREGGRNRSKELAFILSHKFRLFVFWVCSKKFFIATVTFVLCKKTKRTIISPNFYCMM